MVSASTAYLYGLHTGLQVRVFCFHPYLKKRVLNTLYILTGFHVSLINHCHDISRNIRNMHESTKAALPINKAIARGYLASFPVVRLDRILAGVRQGQSDMPTADIHDSMLMQIRGVYDVSRRETLRQMLVKFDYRVDAANTLAIVTGFGRIELVRPILFAARRLISSQSLRTLLLSYLY